MCTREAVVGIGCRVGWNGRSIGISNRRTFTCVIFIRCSFPTLAASYGPRCASVNAGHSPTSVDSPARRRIA
jgi:hypothetical protein